MSRPTAVYLLDTVAFEHIYGPDQRRAIAELADVVDAPITSAELATSTQDFSGVEVVLSGWGAPLMDEAFCARFPKLTTVLYGAGTIRGFATPALASRGVQVTSAVDGNSVPVADYTVAAVYFSLKQLWPVLRGGTIAVDANAVAGAFRSRLGLVALGAVGRLVCERFRGSDIELVAFDPFVDKEEAASLGVELVGIEELFSTCDVVSVHAPLLDSTRGLVTGGLIASMKPHATLLNTARGAVLRQEEVADALARRPDLTAVLDVTDPEPLPADSPLLSMPNVVLTPHVAGSVGRECRRMGEMMVEELRRYAAGRPLRHTVRLDALEALPIP